MRELEQHEGDQRHRDLDRHRALAGGVEMTDPQQLLDPAEEQLDRPAAPIQRRDLLGRRIEVVSSPCLCTANSGSEVARNSGPPHTSPTSNTAGDRLSDFWV